MEAAFRGQSDAIRNTRLSSLMTRDDIAEIRIDVENDYASCLDPIRFHISTEQR